MKKMKYIFILFVILTSVLNAENSIRNSSFELEHADYGVHRFIRSGINKKFIVPVYDTSEKVHGKQSIRFNNPNTDAIELVSREYKLTPGKTYCFSFYMKSSKKIMVRAGQFAGEVIGNKKGDWSQFSARYFTIMGKWKRYSFSFKAKGKRSWYFTQFRWGNANGIANNATLWIDALQLNEGNKPLTYFPKAPVEATIVGKNRIKIKGEKLLCELKIVNYSANRHDFKAELKIDDSMFPEKKFSTQKIACKVNPGEKTMVPVKTSTGCNGHFLLHGNYTLSGKKHQLGPWYFAQIPKVDNNRKYDLKKDSVTGINSSLGRSTHRHREQIAGSFLTMNDSGEQEFGCFLQNTGVRLIRIHGGGFEWKVQEPKPGKFNWTEADSMVNFANKYGLKLMPVLGNMFYLRDRHGKKRNGSSLPKWLLSSPGTVIHSMRGSWDGISPDPTAWQRFVTATVSRYKGKIAAYEITNEPNIALPSVKEYIPYLQSAGAIIRKFDPDAIVVGGSVTTDFGAKTEGFIKAIGKSGAMKSCDAFSFHPYASPLGCSPVSARSDIVNIQKIIERYAPRLSLWNTELYYIGPAKSAFYAVATPATHAQHLLRRLLIDMGEGIKQSMTIHDGQLLQNELVPHWELGNSWGHNGYVPHDLYVGLSIASSLLNGAVAVKRLNWPTGAFGYIYRKYDGQKFASVWSGNDKQKFHLSFPNKNYKVYDMFMNPLVPRKSYKLTGYPKFIFGQKLSSFKLSVEQPLKVSQAYLTLENEGKVLNLEVINTAAETIEAVVRPDFVKRSVKDKLKVNQHKIFKFKNIKAFNSKQAKIYFSDGKKIFHQPFPEIIRKLTVEGETVKVGNFNFSITADRDNLNITINVYDKIRGERKKGVPWTGDSIELFFDSKPLNNFENLYYGETNCRLFIAPKSSNGLLEHKSAMGIDITKVKIDIKESLEKYGVEISIPWKELKMKYGDVLGFDIKVNGRDNIGRQKSLVWSGNNENYRYRNRYGLWYNR